MTLEIHEARVAHDLACLNHGGESWPRPLVHNGEAAYDVIIVGGGQSGLGAAFALLREKVSNILVIDENPAGQEGPWETYARMVTLRTPKHLTAIDLGIPSLTFRAYWEARHGTEGFDAIDKIPRGDWMDYLRWYRRVLQLPVRNDTKLARIEPIRRGLFCLHLADGQTLLARKVVLATGIQGGGQWHTPGMIREKLPSNRYAHTSDPIDYASFEGKRIAILGGGASAFDNAQHALGLGADQVHVFVRRSQLPTVNPIRYMENSGIIPRFPSLSDSVKYQIMMSFFDRNQPPTNDTFERAAAWPGFRLHLGAPWLDVTETDGGVVITTPQGQETFDFLVLSTGLVTDPTLRPELQDVADEILCWADCYSPPAGTANPVLDAHPYLGQGFEFLPKRAEAADRMYGLFAFNYSGLISLGLSASALSGLKHALPRLSRGVADQLFLDDQNEIVEEYLAYNEPEFVGEWRRTAEAAA